MALQLQTELKEALTSLCDLNGGSLPLDDAIIGALPPGTKVHSAHSHGLSASSFTAKINADDSDGTPTPFFLKYVAGDLGKRQLEGEFVGMSELHKLVPDLVPKPIAWGVLRDSATATYFLVIEFKQFVPGLPDPEKLGAKLARMHSRSGSPKGKFGFPVQTYDGARLQAVDWDDSWTSFFSKLLAEAYRQDTETNGVWEELELVFQRAQSHLIPRLIGVLEADGRSVTLTLIHGDLWEGNIGNDGGTGEPWIFDCAAYYAHNEMELGIWKAERHQLKANVYRDAYRSNCEASEPADEWDDRILLYSAKTNFMHSACFAGLPARRTVFNDILRLIQKHVPWEEDSDVLARLRQTAESSL